MATKAAGTRRATKSGNLDVAAIDSYITYVKALIKAVCRSEIRWSMAWGIQVTKYCPMPKGIAITKWCPMPGADGRTDLCAALKSLLAMLLELRAGLASASSRPRAR